MINLVEGIIAEKHLCALEKGTDQKGYRIIILGWWVILIQSVVTLGISSLSASYHSEKFLRYTEVSHEIWINLDRIVSHPGGFCV